jgi:hypothetical protein
VLLKFNIFDNINNSNFYLNYKIDSNINLLENVTNLNKDFVNEILFTKSLDLNKNLFPQQSNNLEVFDSLTPVNNNFLQTLSTPDFKLYYPEPFIASPSFNHEEV